MKSFPPTKTGECPHCGYALNFNFALKLTQQSLLACPRCLNYMTNEQRTGSKEFYEIMQKCMEVHSAKSHDYAQEGNPFSNFERAAVLVSYFNNPIDQVFASLIGIKVARLAELLAGKEPKNESIEDSFLDGTNYFGLWAAYHKSKKDV